MSYPLEMRAFSYIWRNRNSLSLPIYSSSPILKWLVSDYLHPYVKTMPKCYSFGLEKECLGSLSLDLDSHSRELIDIKAWLYASSFISLIYTIVCSLSINVCVNASFILMLLELLSGLLSIMLFVFVCFVVSLISCARIQTLWVVGMSPRRKWFEVFSKGGRYSIRTR